jgi:tetratricopeptide (TPR) repeat protein
VAACAAGAVSQLRGGPAADALRLGQDAIGLLDRHGRAVPLHLLRVAAQAALTSGDGDAGQTLLDRAMRQVQAGDTAGSDPLDQARVIAEQARRLITLGEPEQAEQLLRHAYQLFTAAGSEGEAATAMGDIADIAEQRGDYDEALRIRRQVQLPVYERLGDTRSTALTWGQIADIAYQRGDYDEALRIRRDVQLPVYERLGDTRSTAVTWGKIGNIALAQGNYDEAAELQHKRLEVNRRLGDLDGIAAANWDLARVDLAKQDYKSALPRLLDSFQILRQLQRPDGIATVGLTLGELLLATNETDQGRQVLGESSTAATLIGDPGLTARINQLLNRPDEGNTET